MIQYFSKRSNLSLLFSLITIFILSGCTQDKNIKRTYYKNGSLHKEFKINADNQSGIITEYSPQGAVLNVSSIINKKRNGPMYEYIENGTLIGKYNYKNDLLHGPYETYYDNGNIFQKGQYYDGLKRGTNFEYISSDSGVLHYEIHYEIVRGAEYVNSYIEFDSITNNTKTQTTDLEISSLENELLIQVKNPVFDSARLVIGLDKGFYIRDSTSLNVQKLEGFKCKIPVSNEDRVRGYIENYEWVDKNPQTHKTVSKEIYFEFPSSE